MSLPPDSLAMMAEIDMDYEEALLNPATDRHGNKIWRDVVYAVVRGFRPMMLDVTLPAGAGPFPLVVFVHGGAWFAGHPTISNPKYREIDFHQRLLQAGFAVARIIYRFTSEGKFPMQLHDCKAAVRYLRNHTETFNVDSDRFVAMGDSAGGHLACLIGLTAGHVEFEGNVGETHGSSAVSAVVDWFGPTNFLTMEAEARAANINWPSHDADDAPEAFLVGGPLQENQEAARAASPLTYVHENAPPFLIQHGRSDRMVPFAQSQALADSLAKIGCDVTLDGIDGADHCFWGVDGSPIVDRAIAFLKRTIGHDRDETLPQSQKS